MLEKLKRFCFDVLCDFMEERAYTIIQDRKGNWRVIVLYPGLVHAPASVIVDEWNRQVKGTEFEDVFFGVPVDMA